MLQHRKSTKNAMNLGIALKQQQYGIGNPTKFFQKICVQREDVELGGCNAPIWDNLLYGAVSDDCHFAMPKILQQFFQPWK